MFEYRRGWEILQNKKENENTNETYVWEDFDKLFNHYWFLFFITVLWVGGINSHNYISRDPEL